MDEDTTGSPESDARPQSDPRYSVVGCRRCQSHWIVNNLDLHEQVQCASCGAVWQTDRLQPRAQADDPDVARELRARILADRAGEADRYAAVDDYGVLEEQVSEYFGRQEALFATDADAQLAEHRQQFETLADAYLEQESRRFESAAEAYLARRDRWLEAEAEAVLGQSDQRYADAVTEEVDQDLFDIDVDEASVTLARPGQARVDAVQLTRVGPQVSDWLPDLWTQLLPQTTDLAREIADEHDGSDATALAEACGVPIAVTTGDHQEAIAAAQQYVTLLAAHTRAETAASDAQNEDRREALTAIGTGQDPLNSGLDALVAGPLALHAQRDRTIPITLTLDPASWQEAPKSTRERALKILTYLATVFDVRVVCCSQAAERALREHSEWVAAHLTEPEDGSRQDVSAEDDTGTSHAAYEAAQQFAPGDGHLRVVDALRDAESRQARTLADDPDVDLAAGSISAYLGRLETAGFVDIDRSGTYHVVSLTPLGDALSTLITEDYDVRHPEQAALIETSSRLSAPRQDLTSTVYRAGEASSPPPGDPADGGGSPPTPEEWLTATGKIEDGADYVQWLGGPESGGVMDSWGMHSRLTAPVREQGVTLVDHEIDALDDGRVGYLSCFDDTTLAVVQWGGPLATLVRLSSILLSDKAWARLLNRQALGDDLQEAYDGAFDDAVEDVLRYASQVGWLGEEQETWAGLRDRLQHVRDGVLRRLGELDDGDTEARTELFKDAHGLFATATHLYAAAGLDLQITVRLPDVDQLRRNSQRLRSFTQFFRHTIPKSAGYGTHNAYRNLIEDREPKLKRRMSVDFDPTEPLADLVADWVIVGPDASVLQPELRGALEAANDDVREAIAQGDEETFGLSVPVHVANAYPGIRAVLETHLERKGFQASSELRELTHVLQSVLATDDRGASPYDVATVCLHLAAATHDSQTLGVTDLEHGLAQLPSDRLVPTLPPSARRLLQTILEASEPLCTSQLVDEAGISQRSYDRHREVLEAVGFLDQDDESRWESRLIPWWSPFWTPVPTPGTPDTVDEALVAICEDLGLVNDVGDRSSSPQSGNLSGRQSDRIGPIVRAHFDAIETTDSSQTASIQIGPLPPGADDTQSTLA
ncbi:hypothetical protein SAMN04488065_3030 [Haloplanus vescus]|uniref:DUF5817 domain-containing protein n=1 Tax=Haloplanus vescus TaxID=555874 RepID=A0A1H4AXA3_9EURY|nr:DUF5817 domain-containing protein [Haloplanus vescus]SEA40476.1 hypothetical protein SAMN04488065_3030 [Haloplanus vescus]